MKTLKAFFKSFFGDVIGHDNKILFGCWCCAVVLILALGLVLGSESVSILGVAESREYHVNFDNPVEIKRVHVMPNQVVKKGDLLVELSQADLDLQLRTLKARQDRLSAELKLRRQIYRLTRDVTRLPDEADPLQVELVDTRREIDLIENKLRNLFVFADVDGAVAAVNYKDGEKAPAFAPLVTLVPINPTYVNGYVNENLRSSISIGQIVDVSSAGGAVVQGQVIGVGSRIVPIPERLLRIQSLPAWGREVVVKIPTANGFLLGERVTVKKSWRLSLFSSAQADEKELQWDVVHQSLADIRFPAGITNQFQPEVSGIAYLPEIRQFALISDDYPESRPLILLMNQNGEVAEQTLPIEGLDEMEDIESVSLQGPYIYLLSSLSATSKGNLKKARQLFVQVKRDGLHFRMEKEVDLRGALLAALKNSTDPALKSIFLHSRGTKKDDLEIEGHFVKGDDLYVALKRPILQKHEGLILRIKSLGNLFDKGQVATSDVSIAYRFQLKLPQADSEFYLTDITFEGDSVYVASSCRSDKCSAVWKVMPGTTTAELVQEFDVRKLEGIAIAPASRQIYGVFDNKKNGKFITIPYMSAKVRE
ncbi:HlyD family secretion protein [Bdellovibrio bacteriovorus]|uniref:HlyD family secretion protein n=1 Tax=Bdellovibrio bacteriovorus TaxID=959 RepID=UPI0035A8C4DF